MQASANGNEFVVVLVATRNPLNLGAAARAMQNFGFPALRAVQPWHEAWTHFEEEARNSAVKAEAVLEQARRYDTLQEAVADCTLVVGVTGLEYRRPEQPVLTLPQAAERLCRHAGQNGPVALLFGSEKRGLSKEDLNLCHLLVTIPTRPEQESMNLGQAVAVTLYELRRAGMASLPEPAARPATGEDLARMEELLLSVMNYSKPIPPTKLAAEREALQQLLRRLHLGADDCRALLGTLRRLVYRLGKLQNRA